MVTFNLMSLKNEHRILFKVVVDHSQFLRPFWINISITFLSICILLGQSMRNNARITLYIPSSDVLLPTLNRLNKKDYNILKCVNLRKEGQNEFYWWSFFLNWLLKNESPATSKIKVFPTLVDGWKPLTIVKTWFLWDFPFSLWNPQSFTKVLHPTLQHVNTHILEMMLRR